MNTPFRRLSFLALTMAWGFCGAQTEPPAADAPVRSPAQYLHDFKSLIDSGDVSDYHLVGEILKMPVEPKVGEAVDSSPTRGNSPIAGVSRDFRHAGPAPEYLEYPFLYGDFVPRGGGPARVVLNVYLDKNRICLTREDLETTFGAMRTVNLTDGAGIAYSKDTHGKNDISATFMIFSDSHCAERVGLTQNVQRE
ncbi:MAG: hypothetical protein ABSF50_15245 [Burkholderiaceae bacterium]|jgi:hypothetical protein